MGQEFQDAIVAANKEFMNAFSRGDAASLATLYDQSALLMPPGGDFITNSEGIERFWRSIMAMGVRKATLWTMDLDIDVSTPSDSRDYGHAREVGTYLLEGDGGTVLDRGKYVVVWRYREGQWRIYWDIWNTSLPSGVSE